MGRVIVWLEWLRYSDQRMGTSGQWLIAYQLSAADQAVWVEETNSVPLETSGRRVTHFMKPEQPEIARASSGATAVLPKDAG